MKDQTLKILLLAMYRTIGFVDLLLTANADNLLTVTVTEKRKREAGLVVPASLSRHARITKLVPVLPPKREHRHNLRQSRAYAMPRTHTNRFKNTFIPSMCT